MKINEFGAVTTSGSIKKKETKKTSGSSGFSDLISGDTETEAAQEGGLLGVTKPGNIPALDALLAVQSVENNYASKEALDHGKELLEFLDEIRLGMLSGGIVTEEKINRLKSGINSKRGWVLDKKLTEVINEIELRASVELAKIEMSGKQKQQ